MENKWDEQHLKIMRLNKTLGEQAKAIERLEEEGNELNKQNDQVNLNVFLDVFLNVFSDVFLNVF
jgi:hypothetical protein